MRSIHRSMLERAAVFLALLVAACELNLQNPNAATEEEVLSSPDGMIALAVGMQGQFAGMVEDYVLTCALVTDEWGTRTASLVSYQSLLTGQNFDRSYGVVDAPWSGAYRVIRSANTLLAGAPVVLDGGLETGVVALAKLFKAMAFGTLVLQYERVPITVTTPAPAARPRAEVLDTILALLESARTDLQGVTDAELAVFNNRVPGTAFNLRSTVHAMLARYYLVDGQHQNAIAAADSVSPGTLSVFRDTVPNQNAIYGLAMGLRYVAPLRSFVTQAPPGDRRPSYWADTALASSFAGIPDSVLQPLRKYSGQFDDYPVYLPDEMKLIKAEAFTRLAVLDSAAFYVNAVRTQTASTLDEPVAGLAALDPATQLDTEAKLLAEIAIQRRYELYMQGLRWEDTRRLGVVITTTPVMQWLPIPLQECLTNPNAGC
jgi:starch-binding outer membrane protein, SusD/RagB family